MNVLRTVVSLVKHSGSSQEMLMRRCKDARTDHKAIVAEELICLSRIGTHDARCLNFHMEGCGRVKDKVHCIFVVAGGRKKVSHHGQVVQKRYVRQGEDRLENQLTTSDNRCLTVAEVGMLPAYSGIYLMHAYGIVDSYGFPIGAVHATYWTDASALAQCERLEVMLTWEICDGAQAITTQRQRIGA